MELCEGPSAVWTIMKVRRNCGGISENEVLIFSNGEARLACCASVPALEAWVDRAMLEKTVAL